MSAEISEPVTELPFSRALRGVAYAMDQGLKAPSWMYPWEIVWYIDDFDANGDGRNSFDVKAEMAAIRAGLPRPGLEGWKKRYCGSQYSLEAELFGILFRVVAPRTTVCEKVVKGRELKVVPDPHYVAPPAPMVEREVDIVEWVCSD